MVKLLPPPSEGLGECEPFLSLPLNVVKLYLAHDELDLTTEDDVLFAVGFVPSSSLLTLKATKWFARNIDDGLGEYSDESTTTWEHLLLDTVRLPYLTLSRLISLNATCATNGTNFS